jgi:hypothetical protein
MSGLRKPQSHHNVNLWIVPLKMSLAALLLFAITMTPDMLAAYHVIHLPNWFTMGGIDDARAILGAMLGCVSTVLALTLLRGPAGVVHGGESLRPEAVVPFCAGLGYPDDHRSVHGGFHLRVSCVPGDPSGHAQLIYSAGIINNELVCGPDGVRLPRFLQSQGCDVNSKPRRGWPYCG